MVSIYARWMLSTRYDNDNNDIFSSIALRVFVTVVLNRLRYLRSVLFVDRRAKLRKYLALLSQRQPIRIPTNPFNPSYEIQSNSYDSAINPGNSSYEVIHQNRSDWESCPHCHAVKVMILEMLAVGRLKALKGYCRKKSCST